MSPDVIVDVHIHPIGSPTVSVGDYVRASIRRLKQNYPSLQFQVNPMSTSIVGELDLVLRAVREMHEAQLEAGAVRVSTSLRIDDRRDGVDLRNELAQRSARVTKE